MLNIIAFVFENVYIYNFINYRAELNMMQLLYKTNCVNIVFLKK